MLQCGGEELKSSKSRHLYLTCRSKRKDNSYTKVFDNITESRAGSDGGGCRLAEPGQTTISGVCNPFVSSSSAPSPPPSHSLYHGIRLNWDEMHQRISPGGKSWETARWQRTIWHSGTCLGLFCVCFVSLGGAGRPTRDWPRIRSTDFGAKRETGAGAERPGDWRRRAESYSW